MSLQNTEDLVVPDSKGERVSRRKDKLKWKKITMNRNVEVIELTSSEDEFESSDSSDGDAHSPRKTEIEIIEISDSSGSEEQHEEETTHPIPTIAKCQPDGPVSLYSDLSDTDDGAILTLDEPKSAIRPAPRRPLPSSLVGPSRLPQHSRACIRLRPASQLSSSDEVESLLADPTPETLLGKINTPLTLRTTLPTIPSTPVKPRTPAKFPRTPRTSKKAVALAAQARLEAYAQDLFEDLNRVVFDDELPHGTKLVWSKRLLTTAGRAKWHKTHSKYPLARNVPSSLLDYQQGSEGGAREGLEVMGSEGDAQETRGRNLYMTMKSRIRTSGVSAPPIFRAYPSTDPAYTKECGNCAKVYGRFSKSIRPDAVVCGACKIGKLEALFPVRGTKTQTPKSKTGSRLAAGTARDSPRSLPRTDVDVNLEIEVLVGTVGGLRLEG
ncbi:hypothetical protein EW146_g524 [Bondarzewia mesenterica]|uniref:Uncharacterized protein n=1 Tax=Bondarzewia mesenterica TaxID=1095465 RepID=A0A4S4M722_9AGAM|nr:hypothetical protein EW146_g524 [Bondarzewia mesenterica]